MSGTEVSASGSRRYWPAFLRGDDASEIHARLSGDGDPLRIQEKTARRLREVWILLEQERVGARALALCAHGAMVESPPESLDLWVLGKIDLAIEQILKKDAEAEEREPGFLEESERVFPLLTECMLREPGRVRHYSVEFNALPGLTRRAFFELLIEGRDVLEVIEGGPWNEESLRADIQRALAVLDLQVPNESSRSKEEQP